MSGTRVEGFKPVRGLAMVSAMQSHPPARALALIVIGVIALSLAGCGRKNNLDLPPSASVAPAEAESKSLSPISRPAKPQPRVVPDRKLPIDFLVD
jgi:predicted small lipoprotein YifL